MRKSAPEPPSPSTAARNVVWQPGPVTHNERCALLGQRGRVVWFTGLSGAGKTTIAHLVERKLADRGRAVYLLDGDNLRHGLNSDLAFTKKDRDENIRRIAEVALLLKDAGLIVLVAAISPYAALRAFARNRIGGGHFLEVYVKASIGECRRRDPKGFYAKARQGAISNYTGVHTPYEVPEDPDLVLDTEKAGPEECAQAVIGRLCGRHKVIVRGTGKFL